MIKNCVNCIYLEVNDLEGFSCKARQYQYKFKRKDHLKMLADEKYRNKPKSCCTKKEQQNESAI